MSVLTASGYVPRAEQFSYIEAKQLNADEVKAASMSIASSTFDDITVNNNASVGNDLQVTGDVDVGDDMKTGGDVISGGDVSGTNVTATTNVNATTVNTTNAIIAGILTAILMRTDDTTAASDDSKSIDIITGDASGANSNTGNITAQCGSAANGDGGWVGLYAGNANGLNGSNGFAELLAGSGNGDGAFAGYATVAAGRGGDRTVANAGNGRDGGLCAIRAGQGGRGYGGGNTAGRGGDVRIESGRGGLEGGAGATRGDNGDIILDPATTGGGAANGTVYIGQSPFIPITIEVTPGMTDKFFFISARQTGFRFRNTSLDIRSRLQTAEGVALTATIRICTTGQAPLAGLAMTTWDLNGATNTNVTHAISDTDANRGIDNNDCLAITFSGAVTTAVGTMTILLETK